MDHSNSSSSSSGILRIQKGQEKRIARAYRTPGRGCKIIVHHQKCGGGDASCCIPGRMALSAAQQKRLASEMQQESSDASNHPSISLPFTHEELRRNGTVSGGFIPLILAAIASSIAGGLVERGIAGAGLIWKPSSSNTHGAYHLKPATSLTKNKKGYNNNGHGDGVTKKGRAVGLHIVPYRGKFAPDDVNGSGLYLNPWPRGRGIFPRPALPGDIRKAMVSSSQKKILRALLSQAVHE